MNAGDWMRRRIERERARAAAGDRDATRRWRDLAAAAGDTEEAIRAQAMLEGRTESRAVVERLEVTVRSATPRARVAWLDRFAAGQAEVVQGREGGLIMERVDCRAAEHLRRHPELSCV